MKDKKHHIEYQQRYFDSNYEHFRQAIPAEIEERTRLIVSAAGLGKDWKVLDVGTGTGVLIKYMLECEVLESNITACDLSERMLDEAKKRYPHARFWQGDISEFAGPPQTFDAAFFNACFGNIFDPYCALQVAAGLLKDGGRIVISHPLGNKFVRELQEQNPQLVLSMLPDSAQLSQWCLHLPLRLSTFRDEPELYMAILVRQAQRQL